MKNTNNTNNTNNTTTELPTVLTTNFFNKFPGKNAWSRRNNEFKRIEEVYNFLKDLDFKNIDKYDSYVEGKKEIDGGTLEFRFNYEESCKKVYSSKKIYLNGEKKDIRILRKLLK